MTRIWRHELRFVPHAPQWLACDTCHGSKAIHDRSTRANACKHGLDGTLLRKQAIEGRESRNSAS
mgnify:CR=1 FL=1